MTNLVIVESPAKCKKIQSYLGKDFIVKASFGHFREISNGLKDINRETYIPKFSIAKGKNKVVSELKKIIKQASKIYLATDDDREGEAIAWHICDYFSLSIKSTPRIIFHEITKTAIQKAIQTPTTLDMNKVNAQFARQVLDLIVGYTVSPLLWKAIPRDLYKGSLSAGRCQTPALRLVYDQEREIRENPGMLTRTIVGTFLKINMQFTLEPCQSVKSFNEYFSSKEKTEEFLEMSAEFQHEFSKHPSKETTHNARNLLRLLHCNKRVIQNVE